MKVKERPVHVDEKSLCLLIMHLWYGLLVVADPNLLE